MRLPREENDALCRLSIVFKRLETAHPIWNSDDRDLSEGLLNYCCWFKNVTKKTYVMSNRRQAVTLLRFQANCRLMERFIAGSCRRLSD